MMCVFHFFQFILLYLRFHIKNSIQFIMWLFLLLIHHHQRKETTRTTTQSLNIRYRYMFSRKSDKIRSYRPNHEYGSSKSKRYIQYFRIKLSCEQLCGGAAAPFYVVQCFKDMHYRN